MGYRVSFSILIFLYVSLTCILEYHRQFGFATVVIMNRDEQLKSVPCADNQVSYSIFTCGFLTCSYTDILVQMY